MKVYLFCLEFLFSESSLTLSKISIRMNLWVSIWYVIPFWNFLIISHLYFILRLMWSYVCCYKLTFCYNNSRQSICVQNVFPLPSAQFFNHSCIFYVSNIFLLTFRALTTWNWYFYAIKRKTYKTCCIMASFINCLLSQRSWNAEKTFVTYS